jgi:uncharacterized Zn-binding protein involved in type VI secretion
LEAAGVGHRITHEDDLPKPRAILAALVEELGNTLAPPERRAGVVSAQLGRAMSRLERAIDVEDADHECPDPCGELERGSPNTFIGKDKRAASLADDEVDIACENDSDGPIITGAHAVWVNSKRWARRTDELDCGARVGEGERTVLIGGPAAKSSRTPSSVIDALLTGLELTTRGLDPAWASTRGRR